MSGPDFIDLVGDDLPEEEARRLRRVHELLVEAGPPPELPPSLAAGPTQRREATVTHLPRRRLGAAVLIAAAIAAIAFGGGYLTGSHRTSSGFTARHTIAMHGTNGSTAEASLQLSGPDHAGNWPIRMVVNGLPDLGRKGYYELYLTRGVKQVASCGTFVVGTSTTVVKLNAPYTLPPGSNPGWVVVAHVRGHGENPPILMTT